MVNTQPPLSFTNTQPGTLFVFKDHLETDALCVPALGEEILHSSFVTLLAGVAQYRLLQELMAILGPH